MLCFDSEDHRRITVSTDSLSISHIQSTLIQSNMFSTKGIYESHSGTYWTSINENVCVAERENMDISIQ